MENSDGYLKCFEEQIYDSVNLICLAEKHSSFNENRMNVFYYHTLCRSSVLSTTLLLESAANCCLESLNIRDILIRDLAKEVDKLPVISKFEFILSQINPSQKFDLGCLAVQQIQEIKQLRDRYVHPKVSKTKRFQISENTWDTDFGETNLLKIPFKFHDWKTHHAITVLKSVNDFFNLFFLEWCKLDTDTVCGLLLQEEKVSIPFNAYVAIDCGGDLDKAVKDWNIDFRFLGKKL